MDFIADRPGDGRQFRLPNVPDGVTREGLGIEADVSPPAERVVRAVHIEGRGRPRHVESSTARNTSAAPWWTGPRTGTSP